MLPREENIRTQMLKEDFCEEQKNKKKQLDVVITLGAQRLNEYLTLHESLEDETKRFTIKENELRIMRIKCKLLGKLRQLHEQKSKALKEKMVRLEGNMNSLEDTLSQKKVIHQRLQEREDSLRETIFLLEEDKHPYHFVPQGKGHTIDSDYCVLCHNDTRESDEWEKQYLIARQRLQKSYDDRCAQEMIEYHTQLDMKELIESITMLRKRRDILLEYRNFLIVAKSERMDRYYINSVNVHRFEFEKSGGEPGVQQPEATKGEPKDSDLIQLQSLFKSLKHDDIRDYNSPSHESTAKKQFRKFVNRIHSNMK